MPDSLKPAADRARHVAQRVRSLPQRARWAVEQWVRAHCDVVDVVSASAPLREMVMPEASAFPIEVKRTLVPYTPPSQHVWLRLYAPKILTVPGAFTAAAVAAQFQVMALLRGNAYK